MGHILDTGIRCFRAIRVGISTAAQLRQIFKVRTLQPKHWKTSVLPWGALLNHNEGVQ